MRRVTEVSKVGLNLNRNSQSLAGKSPPGDAIERVSESRLQPFANSAYAENRKWVVASNVGYRGNPNRRSVGSAAQSDDFFVELSSRVRNSALSSIAALGQERALASDRCQAINMAA